MKALHRLPDRSPPSYHRHPGVGGDPAPGCSGVRARGNERRGLGPRSL